MNINFPKPEQDNKLNPLNQLEMFCKKFNETYKDHFWGNIATSSEFVDNTTIVITYAFWVDFLKIKNYSYRFFELKPINKDGGYPLKITAFQSPSVDFGTATTSEELEERINNIFKDERARFIILSNY